jgi:heme-degrading monooxygenase HmoA
MNTRTGSTVVINVFTPKANAMEGFLALQIAALPILRADVRGARGSRLFRAEDNSKVVMVSVFDTADDFKRFSESPAFAAHRTKILPFIERAEPARYELVYEAGTV